MVHDQEDAEVPWVEGAAIAAAWPGAELVTTHRLGHRRILRDPAVVTRVTGFLAAQLARDPGRPRGALDGRGALLRIAPPPASPVLGLKPRSR